MYQQSVIEIFITIAVVCIQLIFFYSTFKRIKEIKNIFPEINLDEDFVELSETNNEVTELIKVDESFSKDLKFVIASINKYLLRNKGSSDFSIIKSIAERNIDSKENFVSANISLPLYIGLMGTFIGVVVGLWKIAFAGGVTEQNINSFIGGVVIAMIASFFGLLLTVINNSYNFKNAKAICDERKNGFYNFLQVELLPYLENNLYGALDRLKNNINDFNEKFEENINLFDSKFSENISSLKDSVQSLSGNIEAIVENTLTQKEFLIEIKNRGFLTAYKELAGANIKVFSTIKDTIPNLIDFVEKQKELNQLVGKTAEFTSTIENIFNRIKTFEQSINQLGENISSKEYLGNEILKRIDTNLSYLDKQFELLKRHSQDTTADLSDFFNQEKQKIAELSLKIQGYIEEAFNPKIENNPLQKLLLLEAIENNLTSLREKVNSDEKFKQLCNDLNSAKIDIQEIKEKLSAAIEKRGKDSSPIEAVKEKDKEVENVPITKRKGSFIKRFTNIFKWNRGKKP